MNRTGLVLALMFFTMDCFCAPTADTHNAVLINSTPDELSVYFHDQLLLSTSVVVRANSTTIISLDTATFLISLSGDQHFSKIGPGDTVTIFKKGKQFYFRTKLYASLNNSLHHVEVMPA